jgi:hypothetical protein
MHKPARGAACGEKKTNMKGGRPGVEHMATQVKVCCCLGRSTHRGHGEALFCFLWGVLCADNVLMVPLVSSHVGACAKAAKWQYFIRLN